MLRKTEDCLSFQFFVRVPQVFDAYPGCLMKQALSSPMPQTAHGAIRKIRYVYSPPIRACVFSYTDPSSVDSLSPSSFKILCFVNFQFIPGNRNKKIL